MEPATRYPEIVVSGPPRQMGRALGETCRERIRQFVNISIATVRKVLPVSRQQARDLAERCIPMARAYSPALVEELEGVAEGAGVGLPEVMMLQVRNQLTANTEACTSISVALDPEQPSEKARLLVGQNWDSDPDMDPLTIVLTRHCQDGATLMHVTQAGLIGYIGLSSTGIGMCLNTLPAPGRETGVPHYFTVREAYHGKNLDEAVEAIRRARRAIPASIMMTTPQGPANLEVTIGDVHVLRHPRRLIHTNHCLHPELAPINDQFPELIQSYSRAERIERLVNQVDSVERFMEVLRDHDHHPRSICRHTNSDSHFGYWKTVLSAVIEPAAQRMWISRGNPCEMPYEEYRAAKRSASPLG